VTRHTERRDEPGPATRQGAEVVHVRRDLLGPSRRSAPAGLRPRKEGTIVSIVVTGRVKALVLLAFALVRTLWRLTWHRHIDGLARFRDNYAADGLTALSESDRVAMRRFGRCIACGRCDRGDGARILESKGQFRGTMGLVLAASRSMPDYRAAARGFAFLTDAELELKEQLCPTHVPLRQLARFVRSNSGAARVSLPAAQGAKRIPSSMPPALPDARSQRGH
jgi:hypothetical protein